MNKLPRIVWTWEKDKTQIRLVQVSPNKVVPEKRTIDDAMGKETWIFTQWDGAWVNDLALEYVSFLAERDDNDIPIGEKG